VTAAPGPAARVDAHHHVWDLSARPQTWMAGDQYQPIARSFGVAELHPQAAAQGVTASVVVQSVGDPAETPELVALAETDSLVAAVVGWVELTRPGVGDRIAQLQAGPGGHRLSGVRHQVHDEPDPRWLCRDDVRRGLAEVGAAGLVYDLLVRAEQLPASLATVRALPDQLFVVDHAAKPRIAAGATDPAVNEGWRAGLLALSGEPNVVCKLSERWSWRARRPGPTGSDDPRRPTFLTDTDIRVTVPI